MEYVYGPVPSRRLGQSLGVDPIPLKTCNWNCVYCQLGRTIPLTNQRKEYAPRQQIIAEVEKALREAAEGSIDWITFVGSGEPTLHSSLGWMIREVKKRTGIPVAVITNGSLFYLPEVREALQVADAVLPSFDAGTPGLYREINRPHPEISFNRLFEGLVRFSQEYRGKLGVEVMLVQGLNDTEKALQEIARKLKSVDLDEVHLAQPTRPPVETWVQPPTEEGLMRVQAILGEAAHVLHPAVGTFNLGEYESLTDALMGIITRHPLKESQILDILEDWSPDAVNRELVDLIESGKAQVVERYGVKFWSGSPSHFPEEEQSERTSPRCRQ
ncbi:MAG: radical SAM protein [Anaerolineales bacterium]|nr:radical SAM protein [Anaerolineales bacterium]